MKSSSAIKAVLGIKCGPQHDTGAAVVYENGSELSCVAVSEERLSRDKQCRKFPKLSIQACLDDAGLTIDDIDLICLDKLGPKTHTLYHRSVDNVDDSIWQAEELAFLKSVGDKPTIIVNHHMSHAATAFCVHDLPEAACLVVDGSGSDYPLSEDPNRLIAMGAPDAEDVFPLYYYERRAETQSVILGRRCPNGMIDLRRKSVSTRSGCGHFYSFFSRHALGFDHLQEGKAMGLAAWGSPELASKLPEMPDSVFAGIDTLMLDHLKEIGFEYKKRKLPTLATDENYAAFAYWMQDVLKDAVMHLARTALEQCGSKNLCMAGGVSLNVVNNRIILDTLNLQIDADGFSLQIVFKCCVSHFSAPA